MELARMTDQYLNPQNALKHEETLSVKEHQVDLKRQYDAAYDAGRDAGLMVGVTYGSLCTAAIFLSYWWLSS